MIVKAYGHRLTVFSPVQLASQITSTQVSNIHSIHKCAQYYALYIW